MNGAITTTSAPMISTENHTVLLPVEIWLGGMKLSTNASSEPQKPRPPTSHIRPLPPLPIRNGRFSFLIMYMLMFSGAIVLRYKMKKLNRPFRIGKNGNGLMWLIGGLGFCGSLLAFVLSFIPPSQISTGSNTVWFSVLIIGALIVVIAPFIIYASKKPSWVDPNSSFEPFHWEEQPAVQTAGKSATNMATGSATASSNGTSNSATSGNTAKDTTNIPKG